MPFFRSNLIRSGGGGGGSYNENYVSFIGSDNTFTDYAPIMNMSCYVFNFNQYNAISNEITEVKIGNRVNIIQGQGWLNRLNINATINLHNATLLSSVNMALTWCNNFNAPVIFPNNISLTYTQYPGTQLYQNYPSYTYFFDNCVNYNTATNIRFHEISTPNNKIINLNLSYMFSGCTNYNARTLFDFDRLYKNESSMPYSKILYYCSFMFYKMYGGMSFNQPMIFPMGLQHANGVFGSCASFNQPVVFDLGGLNGSTTCNLSSAFNSMHMKSDIIILNGNRPLNANNLLRNGRNNVSVNIYCENVSRIQAAQNLFNGKPTLTWTSVTNGVYNAVYNVYILNNVSDGLNAFNAYYYDFYGEEPVFY